MHDEQRFFVLEIGTEEMPPQDVVHAGQQVISFHFISALDLVICSYLFPTRTLLFFPFELLKKFVCYFNFCNAYFLRVSSIFL